MRILYLSQYFPPEMGAPAARVFELSREWARLGHDVTVLTGFPHHPTGVVPEAYRGQFLRREVVAGIRVIRAPLYATANRGRLRRSLSYASFAAGASLLGGLLVERPEVLIASSPQLLTGLAGLWLAGLFRVPLVLEIRDLWPRSIVEVGALAAGSPAVRALERLEGLLYRRADRIVAVSEAFLDHIALHGGARGKLRVVRNGVDLELFRPRPKLAARRALGLPESGFLASYVGTHGMAHGLTTLLEAAQLAPQLQFLCVGEGAEKPRLLETSARLGLRNVTFWDQRPREDVAQILAASDACIVMLKGTPLFRDVIPSKLFEIMGAARPVVLLLEGISRRLVEEAGFGLLVPPEDAQALARTLLQAALQPEALEALGRSGRAYAEAHCSRPALARAYLDLLAEVVA